MAFRIKFVGAVGTVTGSCHLVHHVRSDSYYLVDCGLYQGERGQKTLNATRGERDFAGVSPSKIKAVFLTHAHMDHCGLIPRLYRLGFTGKVYCTRFTARCVREALMDTVRNVEGFDSELFDISDVDRIDFHCPDEREDYVLSRTKSVFGDVDLFYAFSRTGHLPGCVAVTLVANYGDRQDISVTFGADVGPQSEEGDIGSSLVKPYQYPTNQTRYLVLESTYGGRPNRVPLDYERRIELLSVTLERALSPANGSNPSVVIPAFTLGRTQDVLVDLAYLITRTDFVSRIGGVPPHVVVDSKLARFYSNEYVDEFSNFRLTKQGERKMRLLNDEHHIFSGDVLVDRASLLRQLFGGEGTRHVTHRIQSGSAFQLTYGRINVSEGPVIYISSSGMCTSGPVMDRLRAHLRRSTSTVVFSGYVQGGSDARLLKDAAADGLSPSEVALQFEQGPVFGSASYLQDFGISTSDVSARLVDLGSVYSGHADEARLVDYALRINNTKSAAVFAPLTVFLVHGDNKARSSVRRALEKAAREGIQGSQLRQLDKVVIPSTTSGWYCLEKNEWEPVVEGGLNQELCRRLLGESEEILRRMSDLLDLATTVGISDDAERRAAFDKAAKASVADAEVWRRRLADLLTEKVGDASGGGDVVEYAEDLMNIDLDTRPDLRPYAKVLSVHGVLTRQVLISTWRSMAKACHPDAHPDGTDEEKSKLTKRMQEINHAYEALLGAIEGQRAS